MSIASLLLAGLLTAQASSAGSLMLIGGGCSITAAVTPDLPPLDIPDDAALPAAPPTLTTDIRLASVLRFAPLPVFQSDDFTELSRAPPANPA